MANIRTRIAPSPTGYLHVGTARTALFNELFAHGQGGQFIVRIEDTDQERNKPEYEAIILSALRWLGLTWDEGPDVGGDFGPYRQSERTPLYREAASKLLASGAAYQEEGSEAVRLKVAPQAVQFTDAIRGIVSLHSDAWGGDFVIARSPEDPLYHLAVVVDDAAMEISHVIRGEEHLTNTARHILLQRALSLPEPTYAHVPLLLDADRRKLSKRTGEVSLLAFRDKGYLPEAMLNYLALLGWNPKDDTEIFTHKELQKRFSLEAIQKAGAFFSEEKLQAVNKNYVRQLSPEELLEHARPFLEQAGYDLGAAPSARKEEARKYWTAAAATEQERIAILSDLPPKLEYFKPDWPGNFPAERLIWKKSTADTTREILEKLIPFLSSLAVTDYTKEILEKKLMAWIEETGEGRGDVLWPLRVALTGLEQSPGPFEVAAALGKEMTLTRLERAIEKI